jgi:monomeric sarcosine oxidase
MKAGTQVAVVGAGAFGGWTALHLLRRGARVTLLDAWGPGNSRASSGGETRVIRGTYGADQPYTKMMVRAKQLWREYELRWKQQLFHPIGVLWLAGSQDDPYERGSLPCLREAGVSYEELSLDAMAQRWPQINMQDVAWGIYEPDGGYLKARAACQAVLNGFLTEGGEYKQAAALPESLDSARWNSVKLSDGSELRADVYVFACGPWLGKLFPETVGPHFSVTRQEIFFFGTPGGDTRFSEKNFPVWADHRPRFMYGIPGNAGRGFKVADDTRGTKFDPSSGDRRVSIESLELVRDYVGFRFPALKNAPLLESRVCQYENSADEHFIIDQHPLREDVWIAGGGSGHGFKHGPAVGEMLAELVTEGKKAPECFGLRRFEKTSN